LPVLWQPPFEPRQGCVRTNNGGLVLDRTRSQTVSHLPTLSVDAARERVHSRAFVLFNSPQEAAMTHLDLAPSLARTAA
jgi:hypothetical protein